MYVTWFSYIWLVTICGDLFGEALWLISIWSYNDLGIVSQNPFNTAQQ